MAYSIVQKALTPDDSSSSSGNLTMTNGNSGLVAITPGNTIMGWFQYSRSTALVPSVVAGSNTCTVINTIFDAGGPNGAGMFYFVNVSGSPTTIAFSWSSGTIGFRRAAMIEVSGIGGFDHSAAQEYTGVSPATSGNTATLSQSGDFLYGCISNITGGLAVTFTAGTNQSWALQNNDSSGIDEPMADETLISPYSYNSTTAVAAQFGDDQAGQAFYTGIMAFAPGGGAAPTLITSDFGLPAEGLLRAAEGAGAGPMSWFRWPR
jgi:hypothetical protein